MKRASYFRSATGRTGEGVPSLRPPRVPVWGLAPRQAVAEESTLAPLSEMHAAESSATTSAQERKRFMAEDVEAENGRARAVSLGSPVKQAVRRAEMRERRTSAGSTSASETKRRKAAQPTVLFEASNAVASGVEERLSESHRENAVTPAALQVMQSTKKNEQAQQRAAEMVTPAAMERFANIASASEAVWRDEFFNPSPANQTARTVEARLARPQIQKENFRQEKSNGNTVHIGAVEIQVVQPTAPVKAVQSRVRTETPLSRGFTSSFGLRQA